MKPSENKYDSSALRKLLIAILFHTIDNNASDSYIKKQLKWATVTDEEIAELMGD
jgi:hypothetical protein